MHWWRWFPWRFIVRRVARAHGFLDPIALLARLQRFAQPSEVGEPIELLRAGVVFHARGLINSRVIQHNLDWIWPYWIERQFDPTDPAFTPRAFSITHVNLTHRNWTAIGYPDVSELPIVDPRGLLTPFFDGWSIDAWVVSDDGRRLLPSRVEKAAQRLECQSAVAVTTETQSDGLALKNCATVDLEEGIPICHMTLRARSDTRGWVVVALRPYNPEGISFIHEINLSPERTAWTVDTQRTVEFSEPTDRHHVSNYYGGAVSIHLGDLEDQQQVRCDVGMSTAAAMFKLEPDQPRQIVVRIPLNDKRLPAQAPGNAWQHALQGGCTLHIPDAQFQFLYEAALRTLILHSPGEIYAGPFTYKRFWFRDATFIVNALLCTGLTDRAERALDQFPLHQTRNGYFQSQHGEWDSNGQALWAMHRFCELSHRAAKPEWRRAIDKGARWIIRKRLRAGEDTAHTGLLPAGFSAEHLGPIDYYYWDDFWGIAGLRAASKLARTFGDESQAELFCKEADAFTSAVDHSLAVASERLGQPAMPASPYRRLDAGAIGSLAAGYPLQLLAPYDVRLMATVEFLLRNCFLNGGFFQDMIHSGTNLYLTLHVAQVLLRAGDPRCCDLMSVVAELASPTGQWPEAIHPHTHGGCMGDGQHAWAAAEWLLMVRNCFVREEDDRLVLASGIPPEWLKGGARISFGPAPTAFGLVSLVIDPRPESNTVVVSWQPDWHTKAPRIEIGFLGFEPMVADDNQLSVELKRTIKP